MSDGVVNKIERNGNILILQTRAYDSANGSDRPIPRVVFVTIRVNQDGGLKVMIDHRKSVKYSLLKKLPN